MAKGKRERATRDAQRLAHDYTQFSEGQWVGDIGTVGDELAEFPAAKVLIERFEASAAERRACPHLHANPDQPRFWVEAIPEFIACRECTPQLAAEEQRRANTCCVMCGKHDAVRGITVTAGPVVLRGGVCEACEADAGLPT